MSWDPVGLLLMAALLAPVLAIAVWCFRQERAPRPVDDDGDEVMTVALIEARLAREREQERLAEADTVVLPVMRLAADDIVPPKTAKTVPPKTAKTVPPKTAPPRRPPPPPGASGVRILPVDRDHIKRVTEGLFQPPER